MLSTWENHYPLNKDENVLAFYCGVILLELRFFEEAYSMFRKSQQLYAPSATTSYNLGLCCLGLGRSRDTLNSCGKRAALIRALSRQNKAGGNWKTRSKQANWSFYELSIRGFVRNVLLTIMKPELRPSSPEDREFLFRLYASTREEELRPFAWNPAQQEAFCACSSMRSNNGI